MIRTHLVAQRCAAVLVLALVGCGSSAPRTTEPEVEVTRDPDVELPDETPIKRRINPRAILSTGTYSKLVAVAQGLDEEETGESDAGCLLRARGRLGAGYRFEGDVAIAVRPLPEAAADLDEALSAGGGPVRPLTRWGPVGGASEGMLLAAFTALPPVHDATPVALILTERGVYGRTDRAVEASQAGPAPLSRAYELISRLRRDRSFLFVAAEAGVRIADLERVLSSVPEDMPVALAVALPEDTVLPPGVGPARPAAEQADVEPTEGADGEAEGEEAPPLPPGMCPGGLPPATEELVGQLDPPRVQSAFRPLTEAGQRCLLEAANETPGGRVELAFRIAPDGSVSQACVTDDGAGSERLRLCIIERLRELRFPRPIPPGPVDVEAPLVLAFTHQTAICPDTTR